MAQVEGCSAGYGSNLTSRKWGHAKSGSRVPPPAEQLLSGAPSAPTRSLHFIFRERTRLGATAGPLREQLRPAFLHADSPGLARSSRHSEDGIQEPGTGQREGRPEAREPVSHDDPVILIGLGRRAVRKRIQEAAGMPYRGRGGRPQLVERSCHQSNFSSLK